MSGDLRPNDLTETMADRIFAAVHTCGRALSTLPPTARYRALRALCSVFLDEPPENESEHPTR